MNMAIHDRIAAGALRFPFRPYYAGILRLFFFFAVLTVSFDIFLVLNLGINFRATQFFLLFPIFSVIFHTIITGRADYPPGFSYLLLWAMVIWVFVPKMAHTFLGRPLLYGLWLLFSVLMIFTTVQLFQHRDCIFRLVRWYLFTFLFVGAFGVLQFVMPFIGLDPLLVTDWWLPGALARVNGFSYEPSFFASYMLIGWILSVYLWQTGSRLLGRPHLALVCVITTLALIVSGSRMGLAMMVLWAAQYPFRALSRLLIRQSVKTRDLLLMGAVFLSALIIVSLFSISALIDHASRLVFLLEGTGLMQTSSHSYSYRMQTFLDTFELFKASPVIGYSLGGISVAMGELKGVEVTTFAQAKLYEGMCVFAEVLAASGIIGIIPFLIYIVLLIALPFRLAKQFPPGEMRIVLRAMALSLLFALIVLQFNQNILRPYLWLHIAILSALCCVGRRGLRCGAVSVRSKNLTNDK